jgi:formyl-CoA transferase
MAESSISPSAESPLRGIRVLEMSQYIAGPMTSQQLADFGANVVKIERPEGGDPFRGYAGRQKIQHYGHNYRAFNRNKMSVALDLQKPEAVDVIKRLVIHADVLVQNLRPGTMEKLGLSYEELNKLNPGLIYCSISGFVQHGPNKDRPAFDAIGQALSGILYLLTDLDRPRMRGPTIVDQATALQAASAIMALLLSKTRSGVGGRIDISMVDAAIAFIPDVFAAYTESKIISDPESRSASSHALIAPCSDNRLVAIQLGGIQSGWERLLAVLDRPELAEDARFVTRADRVDKWAQLMEELQPTFAAKPLEHWLAKLQAGDIPCAPVLTIPEVFESAEIKHSGLFEVEDHPVAGPVTMIKRAAQINKSRGPKQALPAMLGEHTEAALRQSGFTANEIADLRRAQVFGGLGGG